MVAVRVAAVFQCFGQFSPLSWKYFVCYWVVKPHGIVLKKLNRLYYRKSVKVPANISFEWIVGEGRQRPRCTVRGRGWGISRGIPRPKHKGISTGSGSPVAEASTQEFCLIDSILVNFDLRRIKDQTIRIYST